MCSLISPPLGWLAAPIRPIASEPTISPSISNVTRRQVFDAVIGVKLMKMSRAASKDSLNFRPARQELDVSKRIDALDRQLSHRLPPQAAVRTVDMRGDLMRVPVQRRIALLAAALRRAGVFGEVEVGMNRIDSTHRACCDLLVTVLDCREKVAVPHQKPYAALLDRSYQSLRLAAFGRQRLILHDVYAYTRRPNTQIAMPLGFRTDDRDLHVEFSQRPLDIADIRNLPSIRELLIPLVRQSGTSGSSATTTNSNRGCEAIPRAT